MSEDEYDEAAVADIVMEFNNPLLSSDFPDTSLVSVLRGVVTKCWSSETVVASTGDQLMNYPMLICSAEIKKQERINIAVGTVSQFLIGWLGTV